MKKTFSTMFPFLLTGVFSTENSFDVANEAATVANETSGFVIQTEYAANVAEDKVNWVQLSPFGKFPHPLGMQVFNKADSENCVNEFNSVWNTIAGNGTKLGFGGLPWYVGHPDNDAFRAQYPDKSAKGRIKQLETRHAANCNACNEFCNQTSEEPCREHGLFGNVKWNDEGKRLIGNEAYHGHSVNWRIKRVGAELHPVFLKSVGFTNEPNIPVSQITAANEAQAMKNLLDYINELLKPATPYATNEEADAAMKDYCNEAARNKKTAADATATIADMHKRFCTNETFTATEGQLTAAGFELPKEGVVMFMANEILSIDKMLGDTEKATKDLTTAGVTVPEAGVIPFLANEIITSRGKVTKAEGDLTAANEKVSKAATDLANERSDRAKTLCQVLLAGGFVNKAEHDALITEFGNEATYTVTMTKALAMKPKYAVASQVGLLGNVDSQIKTATELQSKLNEICNEIQTKHPKKSRLDCWELACNTTEGKSIVAQMKVPDTSAAKSRRSRNAK